MQVNSTNGPTGVDSDQLHWENEEAVAAARMSTLSTATIAEDKLAEAVDGEPDLHSPTTPRHAKKSSLNRLSKATDDRRLSGGSSKLLDGKSTDSNRSSATIRPLQTNGHASLNEADFEKALRRFANERETFVNDLTLSAGAVIREKPKPRTKPQRIVSEDVSGLKSGLGSIRRRISFREMGTVKRTPSLARQGATFPAAHATFLFGRFRLTAS